MRTLYNEIESVTFPSKITNIQKVEVLVDQVCQNNNIHEDYYGNILIAVTEAVNNAIVHGNLEDESKSVSIVVKRGNDELSFLVSDEGEGFAFNNLPDPTSPENIEKEDGRGIFLMKALADKVEFLDNGTKVLLTFSVMK